MRTPKFLSPSSVSKWRSDRVAFYKKYLADIKTPREPQAIYMGVGSGFDARVKSEIMTRLMGKPLMPGSAYHFPTLFKKQVEHHHRDRVMKISKKVWDSYVFSGAFESLFQDIKDSPYVPLMEEGLTKKVGDATLFGYPDLAYIDRSSGLMVITDWKILGSASKPGGGASPPQGYRIVRHGWEENKPQKGDRVAHKKHIPTDYKGLEIGETPLEELLVDWANQLTTYAWLLGQPVASQDFVVRIECAACRHPIKANELRIKWSTHVNRVSTEHQIDLMGEYNDVWKAIESGHIFDSESREDSDKRCEVLDMSAASKRKTHSSMRGLLVAPNNFFMGGKK